MALFLFLWRMKWSLNNKQPKYKKLVLNSQPQTYQILINDDQVKVTRKFSSFLVAVDQVLILCLSYFITIVFKIRKQ